MRVYHDVLNSVLYIHGKLVTGIQAAEPVDDGDIFCDTPDTSGRKLAVGLDEAVRKASFQKGLTDSYDDPEGYYNFQIGEILDNRYEVFASKGKGVFSTVLRARDKGRRNANDQHPEVAIKMIRSNDMMRKSGQTEEEILKLLACSDPENKRHCIRLLRSFEYRGHLCLVFEPMVCCVSTTVVDMVEQSLSLRGKWHMALGFKFTIFTG